MPPSDQELMAAFHAAQGLSFQPHRQGSSAPNNAASDRELMAVVANAMPMGWGEDAGRSLVTGAERGVTSIAGLPNTVAQLQQRAGDWLANAGRHAMGRPSMTAQEAQGAHAITGMVDRGLTGGLVNPDAPSQAQLDQGVQHFAGPYHNPQTWQGRTAEGLGEMLPGAALPGGLVARAGRVLIPAATSAAAGEVAHGTPYEGLARALGGGAGGLLEGGLEGISQAPARVLGNAAPGLTEDQMGLAAALRESAARQGISLTIPEAVQQVTGGATSLGRVQRVVESAGRTAPQLAPYFAERPGQVRQAVGDFASGLAPNMPSQPGMVGLGAQRAAEGAQIQANGARASLAGPDYTAAGPQTIDRQALADILGRVDTQSAADKTGLLGDRLQQFRNDLIETPARPGTPAAPWKPFGAGEGYSAPAPGSPATPEVPLSDIDNLQRVRNYWRDQIDIPPVGQDPLTKEQAGAIGGHLKDLEALIKANPDHARGDQLFKLASEAWVDPLNTGPVGKIGATGDLGAQTGALYPARPFPGQANATGSAVAALNAQDPNVAANLTRAHLTQALDQVGSDTMGRPNQFAGAALVRNVAPGGEKAATLQAGLQGIDPSGAASSQWSDLVQALAATGQRERPGSMTAFNSEDLSGLKQPGAVMKLIGGIGDPLEWTKNLSNWTGGKLYGRNLDILANMLTDPDTAAILQKAAAARGGLPPGSFSAVPLLTQQGGGQ